jgi:hypothetical protein
MDLSDFPTIAKFSIEDVAYLLTNPKFFEPASTHSRLIAMMISSLALIKEGKVINEKELYFK